MAEYKAFFVDPDRHIEQREDFAADDDEAALKHAKQWAGDDRMVEVWSQGIFVGTIKPVSQTIVVKPAVRQNPRRWEH